MKKQKSTTVTISGNEWFYPNPITVIEFKQLLVISYVRTEDNAMIVYEMHPSDANVYTLAMCGLILVNNTISSNTERDKMNNVKASRDLNSDSCYEQRGK